MIVDWLEEIDLGISGPPVSMGVRKLGNRPWLFTDENTKSELSLKSKLSKDLKREVFLTQPETEEAGEQVLSLIEQAGMDLINDNSLHPLEKAGLSVQEDLCLVQRSSKGWILKAASLSFPSFWKLSEKIGRNMAAVHGPVDDYPEFLEKKIDRFFDRLGQDPVWRRNWFIHADNSLHQPDRLKGNGPIVECDDVCEKLFIRSERQTLRALNSKDWILFTIRVQQSSLKNLIDRRRDDFTTWIHRAPTSHHLHKSLQEDQLNEIKVHLSK